MNNKFNKNKLIKFWLESSDDDFDTMLSLYKNKKYHWSLFIGHLVIEKLLKALYIKINKNYPPLIHNLLRLSELCNLSLNENQELFMITVTSFNINARYDDYKKTFKKKCTPDYTNEWIEKIKQNREWIKKLIVQ